MCEKVSIKNLILKIENLAKGFGVWELRIES